MPKSVCLIENVAVARKVSTLGSTPDLTQFPGDYAAFGFSSNHLDHFQYGVKDGYVYVTSETNPMISITTDGMSVLGTSITGAYFGMDFGGFQATSSSSVTLYYSDLTSTTGTTHADTMNGTNGPETLRGNSGDDHLIGNGGGDHLIGGAGNDLVEGGAGNDRLYGALGNDVLDGGTGNDQLFGGDGNDLLIPGAGSNDIDGGTGTFWIMGRPPRRFIVSMSPGPVSRQPTAGSTASRMSRA